MNKMYDYKNTMKEHSLLLVEDDEDISKLFSSTLKNFYKNVYISGSEDEAYDIFINKKPDVIITDIMLSQGDGLNMIKRIRELNSNIPVVVASAFNQKEFLEFSINYKVAHFFSKPVNFNKLLEVLNRFSELINIQQENILYTINLKKEKESTERFLANMSHEIRTPLTAILGFLDLLGLTSLDTEQAEYLNIIKNSSKDLMVIINDILDISKIEAGKLELEYIPFDIREFELIEKLFSSKVNSSSIHILTEIDSNIPKALLTDPTRLKQIIQNLVSNAVKFTQDGYIKIEALLEVATEDRVQIRFSVSDTGQGIPQERISTLFDEFTQVEKSDTRKHGGTGLGLKISKDLVSLFDSNLQVKSVVGEGTEFFFTVEMEISKEKIEEVQEEEYKELNLRLLVAEDVEVNQKLIKAILNKYSIYPDQAFNGLEAVELYKKNDYDLIFMDINMPVLNGISAGIQIIEYEKENNLEHTPIYALTANILDDEIEMIRETMDGHLAKPIVLKEMLKILNLYTKGDKLETSNKPLVQREEFKQLSTTEIADLLGLDEELLSTLIDEFIQDDLPVNMIALENAIVNKYDKEITYIAHTIKGSAANLMFEELSVCAKEIEYLSKINNNYLNIQAQFKKLKVIIDSIIKGR